MTRAGVDGTTTPGLVCAPPPPLLGAGARHARAAADPHHVRRDPRAHLVARSTARSTSSSCAGRRASARSRRSRPAPPRIVDHHSSPNAIEGSLDVIARGVRRGRRARALLLRGHRSQRRSTAPRRAWPRTSGSSAPAGAGFVGAHACFTLSDDTLDAVCGLAADLGVGVHIHVAEDPRSTPARATGSRVARRRVVAAGPRVHLERTLPGHRRAQPALEPQQRGGLRAPGPLPTRSCSAPTASAPTCSRSSGSRSRWLARRRRRRHARRRVDVAADRARAGARGARDDRVDVVATQPMEPWHLAYTPGVRPLGWWSTARCVLDESGPTRVDAAEIRARAAEKQAPRRLVVASRMADLCDVAGTRRACTCRTPTRSATACATRRAGRGRRVRSGVAGREPARARGDGPARRVRGGDRAHQARVRRRSACGCATPRSSPPRSPPSTTSRPGRVILGIGAWWDPLAAEGRRVSRDKPLRAMREIVTVVRALLANETVTFDGEFVAPRRGRARLRAPGATTQGRADRHRRHRHADDEAGGRDRRRRAAQLPRVAGVQRAVRSPRSPRVPRSAGRTLDDIDRPQLVVCSMDDDRDAALDAARLLVTQYLGPAAAHHEGVGGARGAARRDRPGAHVAGDARARSSPRRSSSPTTSCS